jgi:tryptophanyl-tRNA synthetase
MQPDVGKERVLSGMQPSGALHLGNWMGALAKWVELQDQYECFFMVADIHALTTGYQDTGRIPEHIRAMAIDWLAAGLDPARSVLFVQSAVPAHAELFLVLSMLVPLGWLERVPSYKEKLRELEHREIHTYGFLGYPALQAADILLYRAAWVPVGQDQVPHIELTREIARRFNHFYGPVLREPEALLGDAPVLPGLDGRKMSKSYGNTIALADSADTVAAKIRTMVTDPARVRRTDPGHPEVCPVFQWHRVFNPDCGAIEAACRTAQIGCVDCKRQLAALVNARLEPIRERREVWASRPDDVEAVLVEGSARAREAAETVMDDVRAAMHLTEGRTATHGRSTPSRSVSG